MAAVVRGGIERCEGYMESRSALECADCVFLTFFEKLLDKFCLKK